MVGERSNGGIIEVDGGRSNNGTIEVVGGDGLMGKIFFGVGFVGSLVSMLDVDSKGEGGGIVDEVEFCFGFNLIVDCIFIFLNELRFEGPVLPFSLNSALVL